MSGSNTAAANNDPSSADAAARRPLKRLKRLSASEFFVALLWHAKESYLHRILVARTFATFAALSRRQISSEAD